MTRVVARGVALGALRSADLDLAPGRYVVLSSEREPLRDLVAVLSGQRAPRAGQLSFDGSAPAATPATRRKLAALLAEEALPPAQTVAASLTKALAARAESGADARQLLADAGLSSLGGLSPAALDARETRSVALALALSHGTAEVLVLHEPLATLLPAAFVLARLDAHTARGAIVLGTTTSPADATALGGTWLCIELGRLRAASGPSPRLGAGPWQRVLVETNDARALSQLLHASPQGLSTELGSAASSLTVIGPALDVTVREIVALAREHGLELQRIEAAVPPVEALLAARAGFARGAYEASRVAAIGAFSDAAPTRPGVGS